MTQRFEGLGTQSHAHATALLLSSKRALDAPLSTVQLVAQLAAKLDWLHGVYTAFR